MGITITNTTLSDPIDKSEIEQNFSDVSSWPGNIANADISASAGIQCTKFAQPYIETRVQLSYQGGSGLPGGGAVLDITPLPGSDGDEAWRVTDVGWVCTDTGDGNATYTVQYGYYESSGSWLSTVTLINAGTLPNSAAGANSANQEYDTAVDYSSGATLNYSGICHSFRLINPAAGANYLSAATDFLSVALVLRRKLQGA